MKLQIVMHYDLINQIPGPLNQIYGVNISHGQFITFVIFRLTEMGNRMRKKLRQSEVQEHLPMT